MVDVTSRPPVVLRPGGLPLDRIRRVVPTIGLPPPQPSVPARELPAPRSPGLKHRHYAPRTRLTLYVGPVPEVWKALRSRRVELASRGVKSALLVTEESAMRGEDVWILGSRRAPSTVARRLFTTVRDADARGVEEILVERIPVRGLGLAVMNRLARAAEGRVVTVARGGEMTVGCSPRSVRFMPRERRPGPCRREGLRPGWSFPSASSGWGP